MRRAGLVAGPLALLLCSRQTLTHWRRVRLRKSATQGAFASEVAEESWLAVVPKIQNARVQAQDTGGR